MTDIPQSEFGRALEGDCDVKLDCTCGFDAMFDTFEAFNEARINGEFAVQTEGDWDWAFAHEQTTITCPDCGAAGSETELRGRGNAATIAISIGTDISTRELEGDAIVGATAPIHERRVEFTESLEDGVPVIIDCGCGNIEQFDSGDALQSGDIDFVFDGSHLGYALAGNKFTITCPDCTANAAVATLQERDGTRTIVLTVTVGDTCPVCDDSVRESGFKEGPEAPEIGWEYYECPACETQMRIERVESSS